MSLQTGGFARSSTPINPGLVDPRLLAIDYSKILEGAGQGLQLVSNYGQLQDQAMARDQAMRTREAEIAAANAKANLTVQQAGADLQLLPQETLTRGTGLQLKNLQLGADLERNPRVQELNNLELDTGLGKQRFELANQPRAQALKVGEQNLQESGQKLEKQKQELDAITNETSRLVAEETQAFMKENPEMTQQDLQAKLMQSKRLLSHMEKLNKFEKDNPDFVTSGAAAEYAKNKATVAVGDATVKSGGIAPASMVVNPGREFSTRSARNLADADKILNFGSLEAIKAFQATPEGKDIVGRILSAPQTRPYRFETNDKTKKDKAAVEAFRKRFEGLAPQDPSAAPAAAAPQAAAAPKTQSKPTAARQYPTLSPQEAAMQPPGTFFYDTSGNLRQRN